ncbi:MAG TPA: hypothetical protein DCM05_02065 [Elusimicrobia bacterium]|nr:hypothetical protein [Elusimicrobiota bacterium]
MKTLSILSLGVILGAALLFLLLGRSSAPKGKDIDSVLKTWEQGQTAPEDRKVAFVLDDARHGRDPLGPSEEPSAFDKLQARLGLGRPRPSLLSGALLEGPDAVLKQYDPLFDKGEDIFIRSLANDLLRASRAGAQIDIVAQGRTGEAALKAVKLLEGDESKPGIPIRSLVTTGTDEKSLRNLDPAYFEKFKRPRNLQQWANLWKDKSGFSLVSTFYTPEGSGGGTLGESYLSQGAQQALLRGADVQAFEQAVLELGKMLAAFRVRGGAWPRMVVLSMKTPLFAEPPKAMEPPQRVFRDIYGRMSGGGGASVASPTGGRTGGYGYEAPAAPDMAALQPGAAKKPADAAPEPVKERRPAVEEKAPAPRPSGKAEEATVLQISECHKVSSCYSVLPLRLAVSGVLTKKSEQSLTWMYELCEPSGKPCLQVASVCHIPDGRWRIVGSFRKPGLVSVRDCAQFERAAP